MNTTHPLVGRKLTTITSFEQWKQLWEKAGTYEELASLLHILSRVPDSPADIEIDRFLLRVADGRNLGYPDGESHHPKARRVFQEDMEGLRSDKLKAAFDHDTLGRTVAVLRAKVAQVAWAQLCNYYFKHGASMLDIVWPEQALVRLRETLEFFGPGRYDNLPLRKPRDEVKHYEYLATNFLLRLVSTAWYPEERNFLGDKGAIGPFAEMLAEARPNLVYVLNHLGRLNVLLELPAHENAQEGLKAVALAKRPYFRMDEPEGPFETIDEALKAGSTAAAMYVVLERRLA